MRNLLLSPIQLRRNFLQQAFHSFLAIEHRADFLIAGNVVLDFLLQGFVDAFVFEDAEEALVDFGVQGFVFVCELGVLFAEGLAFEDGLVEFGFGCAEGVLQVF